MASSPNHIVFLCYGNMRVIHECTYALLSLSGIYPEEELKKINVWLYTDNAEWFQSLKECPISLNYRTIDKQVISKWRGAIDFVHRVKIEMLRDFTARTDGNILYLDSDIIFTRRPDDIFASIDKGLLYMHTQEGVISHEQNLLLKKLNRHLGADREINGMPLNEMAMWNAGVLGFNTQHKRLLEDVLAFTDAEYKMFPKHIIEQFAFSVYFQMTGKLKAAAPYIFHYWKLKEAGIVLNSFFEHFKGTVWGELERMSALVQIPALMQEKTDFLHNRGVKGALLGTKWEPAKRNWDDLA